LTINPLKPQFKIHKNSQVKKKKYPSRKRSAKRDKDDKKTLGTHEPKTKREHGKKGCPHA
jgi:hypothetical protein